MAGAVGQRSEFWWDEVARGILARGDALECDVPIGRESVRISLPAADSDREAQLPWRAWREPRTDRERCYVELWRRLQRAPAVERSAAMRRFRQASNITPPEAGDLPLTPSEVAEIAADGLIEVGGHTVTHPVLPSIPPAERRREILDGRRCCERLVNGRVTGFAYPHGAMDADSRQAVEDCGFTWACSTESHAVPAVGFDLFALPRLGVLDWDGSAFEGALASANGREAAQREPISQPAGLDV